GIRHRLRATNARAGPCSNWRGTRQQTCLAKAATRISASRKPGGWRTISKAAPESEKVPACNSRILPKKAPSQRRSSPRIRRYVGGATAAETGPRLLVGEVAVIG